MIGTRGKNRILVLEPKGIPIQDVADAITDGNEMDWILTRFPITEEEVFEVIDIAGDLCETWEDSIVLKNVGDEENIDLEATNVNSTMFFNTVKYGRILNKSNVFPELFRSGLVTIIAEIYADKISGKDAYTDSPIHHAIWRALMAEIGDVDPTDSLNQLADSEERRKIPNNFNIGDEVMIVNLAESYNGKKGTITNIDGEYIHVKLNGQTHPYDLEVLHHEVKKI